MTFHLRRFALVALFLAAASLHADTPFYTEDWSSPGAHWNNVGPGSSYSSYNNTLYNNQGGDMSQPTQMMYTGTLPYGWDYSIQSDIVCNGSIGTTFIHYLRGGTYQVVATVDSYSSTMDISVYVNGNSLGGVRNLPCQTIKSTITGTQIAVSVGGTTIISTSDGTGTTGGPGVGTTYCNYPVGIQTTVLAANPAAPPNVPTNLTTSHVYAWQMYLSWTPSSGTVPATSYNVYRENPGGSTFNNIGSIAGGSCSSTCQFNDPAVYPGTTYNYRVTAVSSTNLESSPTSALPVTTASPSYAAPDAGGPVEYASTWGAGPEKISLLTGALGVRVALPKLMHRGRGPGLPMTATWNSQIWGHDSTGDHFNAIDTGYGLGWTFQAGAMYPVMSGSNIDHFELQDGGGVIHKLYQVGSSTQFKSQDSTYMLWDYSTRTLMFKNGVKWVFGCNSIGVEFDAGTLYPTLLEDTNGNLINITYQAGQISTSPATFSSQANTSSRIATMTDAVTTYVWTYSNGHVASVYHTASGTSYYDAQFTYVQVSNIVSPFCTSSCATQSASELTQITYTGSPAPFVFSYDTSGEMTQLTMPYKGYFRYTYNTKSFSSGARLAREISARYMSADGTSGSEQAYTLSHQTGSASDGANSGTTILDPTGSQKTWNFTIGSSAGWNNGLTSQMLTYDGTSTVLRTVNTTWTQDDLSSQTIKNPRIYSTTTVLQDGSTQTKTEQDVDSNGNVTAVREYALGVGAPGALYRTTTTTYVTTRAFISLNMLDLPASVTVCAGAAGCSTPFSTKVLGYDEAYGVLGYATYTQHDPNFTAGTYYRGNVISVFTNGIHTFMAYDLGGNLLRTTDVNLNTLQGYSYDSVTGQPLSASSGGNTTTVSYNGNLTINSVTGSNTDSTTFGYSPAGYRTTVTTNPDGSQVHYGYADMTSNGNPGGPWSYPYTQDMTSAAGKKTRSILDGFGRTLFSMVQETSGTTQTWITTATQYNPCSCSSTGKAVATSRPYHSDANGNVVSGETVYWTTTVSDGLGRPKAVTLPDGHQTTYAYAIENDTVNGVTWLGATTTITDPMGKQKRYLYDSFGNLWRVDEPNASNALIETARYTYDLQGRMIQVGMRKNDGSYTQTRTFVYNAAGQLATSTTPEKGMVNYYYTTTGLLDHKIDAKSQTLWYAYDTSNRLTSVSFGSVQSSASVLTSFTYDTATNGVGKMATATGGNYTWSYNYDVTGRVTTQTLLTPFTAYGYLFPSTPVTVSSTYSYDSDGKTTGTTAPAPFTQTGAAYQYNYDAVGRPTGLNAWDPDASSWYAVTSNGAYNAAGQMTGWTENKFNGSTIYYTNLARTYDAARGWMTGLTVTDYSLWPSTTTTTLENMGYSYNANGQVTSISDTINSGQGVTSYTYDNLNRLQSATTPNWSMAWTYDEFGNRLTQTGTGSASSMGQTLTYDTSTNRITGHSYDANGNMDGIYDPLDHLAQAGSAWMSYDAFGRRIARQFSDGTTRFYFYDPSGKLTGEFVFNQANTCNVYGNITPCPNLTTTTPSPGYLYFAGQRVGQWTDRVGSKRRDAGGTQSHYYPYGEEITGTANDTYKFASLYRDSDSGLDYAMNRYYADGVGRFLTADSFLSPGAPKGPQGWNAYSYAEGDPANGVDPRGNVVCFVNATDCNRDNVVYNASLCSNILSFPFAPPDILLSCGVYNSIGGGRGDQRPIVTTPKKTPRPPCFETNSVVNAEIAVLTAAAQNLNETVGIGATLTASAGAIVGWTTGGSLQLVVSPNGQAAFTFTTPNAPPVVPNSLTTGAGIVFGSSASFSNASTPQDLAGQAVDYGYTYGAGLGLAVDYSVGRGTSGQLVWQNTYTFGFGLGEAGHGLLNTYTVVIAPCQ